MTILSCQKRHHEPHWVLDYVIDHRGMPAEWCDGLPRWPYARPKPPPLANWISHGRYAAEHGVVAVYKDRVDGRWTAYPPAERWKMTPTHAEAITYAQDLVNERRKNSGSY